MGRFLREAGLADVGICFDAGHAHLEASRSSQIAAVGEWILTTHLHDNHGLRDEHLPPFAGTIPWQAILQDLANIAYDGCLLLEFHGEGNDFPTAVGVGSRSLRPPGGLLGGIEGKGREGGVMAEIAIREAADHEGGSATIRGWLYHHRSSGKIIFLVLRDGTGLMQAIVLKNAVPPAVFQQARELTRESSLEVTGTVRRVPEGKTAPGGFEMEVTDLKTIQRVPAERPFPISPKEHGIEFLLDHRHLWLRSSRQHAILRVRHEVIRATRDFFDSARVHPGRHSDLHPGGL